MQTFNYHTHTYRCNHADNVPDEAYVEGHLRAGFDRMAFTDHCPWAWFDARTDIPAKLRLRMRCDQKAEYLSSVNELKEKYKDIIKIYSGFEVEFVPDCIDDIRQMYSETDILLLGQHTIMNNGRPVDMHMPANRTKAGYAIYADLVEQALSTGMFKIFAHPDLFMIMSESFGEEEEKTSELVLKSAERYDIPIEINLRQISKPIGGESSRTSFEYPCPEFWKMATSYNVKVVYGIDAHRLYQFDLHEKIMDAANKHIGAETLSKLHFLDKLPFEDRN